MFSDAFPIKLVDDLYFEVEGKNISVSNDIDASLLGGNASAEGGEEEGVDASTVTGKSNSLFTFLLLSLRTQSKTLFSNYPGINIVLSCKLQETSFDAASYTAYVKVRQISLYIHAERFKSLL